MGSIRINLIGEFQCFDADGQPLNIATAKDQGLVAILTLSEGARCSRSRIIELLWSTRGEDQAMASLRQSLWSLKKALGNNADELLQVDRKRISINTDEVKTDIAEFQTLIDSSNTKALAQAMSLYRGDLLEGLVIRDSEWETWLDLERESLRANMTEVLNTLIDHYSAESNTRQLIDTGRRLLALDPFQEKGHRALMRGYAENNQKALALKQFGRCRELLQRELNTAPAPETQTLFKRIQSGEINAVAGDEPNPLATDTPVQTNEPEPEETAPGTITTRAEVERRQLTVMCCDLVDSDVLSRQFDPEDLLEISRIYRDICQSVIARYEGYMAQVLGHRFIAYFGYPQAHEDDAERAIHAGLGITREIVATRHDALDITFAVRIGIATGEVVVGDLIGDTFSRERAVVGETPNQATRLLSLADPNSIVIGSGTRTLVASRFEYEDLGDPESLYAWRVIAPVSAESRFAASHPSDLTPLVGREHEIALLLERWEQAKEGDGQVVMLSGEAGIGKSRIAETLKERISLDDPICLRYQCSPYHSNSYLYPVIDRLERAAQINAGDTPDLNRDKLKSLLAQGTPDIEAVVTHFALLLSIPAEKQEATTGISPDQQKALTLEALVAQMAIMSQQHPVLMIFEDTHWADPTSLELLELTIGKARQLPVLIVMTFRPEFTPPWSDHTHITALTLNRFTRSLTMTMVNQVKGGKSLPNEVQRHIIEKADGVPLFVEELTKTLLESGLLSQDTDRYTLSGSLSSLNIPATLQDSLMSRLDRLATGKQVAQAGAAIGREFSRKLLESVCGLQQAKLNDSLDELVNSGLVFRQDSGPGTIFMFKHALVQEAAYASLLKKTRKKLHQQIAETLLDLFPESTDSQPELLAHHYTEADNNETAINYWLKAGQRAAERSANHEAVAHLNAGLEALLTLPESTERSRHELDFQLALCSSIMVTKGWGSKQTSVTYARARELCSLLGETEPLSSVLNGEYMRELSLAHFHLARDKAKELLRLGEQQENVEAKLQGHRINGWVSMYLGEFSVSRKHVDEALRLYHPEQHEGLKFRYAHDPRVAALSVRAMLQSLSGYPQQATKTAVEALDYARSINHTSSLAYGLFYAGAMSAVLRHDSQKAGKYAEEVLLLSERLHSGMWLGFGRVIAGWSAGVQQINDNGVQLIQQGLENLETAAPNPCWPLYLALLAEVYLSSGEIPKTIRSLKSALKLVEKTDERMCEAEIHRLLGEALLIQNPGNEQEAESRFMHAIEVAVKQEVKLIELRATVGLAQLKQSQGKAKEARMYLEPIYNWFTEGFDTPDLIEAAKLLEQLP